MHAVKADIISMILVLFKYFIIGMFDLYAKKREYKVRENIPIYVDV